MEQPSFVWAGATHLNSEKNTNEAYFTSFTTTNGAFFVLADSQTNDQWGAVASRIVADSLREHSENNHFENILDMLQDGFMFANKQLFLKKLSEPELKNVVVNCSIVGIKEMHLFYAIAGSGSILFIEKEDYKEFKDNINMPLGQSLKNFSVATIGNYKNNLQTTFFILTESVLKQIAILRIAKTIQQSQALSQEVSEDMPKAIDSILTFIKALPISQNATIVAGKPLFSLPKESKTIQNVSSLKILGFVLLVVFAVVAVFWYSRYYQEGLAKQESNSNQSFLNQREREAFVKDSFEKIDNAKDLFLPHNITKGESIGSIAGRYNMTPDDFINLNEGILDDKFRIQAGQKAQVRIKTIYTLEKNQTLQELYENRFKRWKKFGITSKTIIKANKTATDSLQGILEKGRKIIIPAFNKKI